MLSSCSISLREGTSSGHVPASSGSWVSGACVADMPRSGQDPGRDPARLRAGQLRWAGAAAGTQPCPPSAGRSPPRCPTATAAQTGAATKLGIAGSFLLHSASLGSLRSALLCPTAALVPGMSHMSHMSATCHTASARRTRTDTARDCLQPCGSQ